MATGERYRRHARDSRGGLARIARRWSRPLLVLVVIASAIAYGASILRLPEPRPAWESESRFSAERAMEHVREVAKEPHPAGSQAMVRVAGYIADQLTALGLELEPLAERDPQTGVELRVVVARINGRDPTGAVLFVTHPDSVPEGPGAGDNATGVATLLETARALNNADTPRNDLIFLFDDGEERGYYPGAQMFAVRHRWMRDVKLVVGLDTAAWGVPFLMQDSENNGTLIRGFAEVDSAVGLGFDASTNREDASEIDVFRRAGIPGIELEDTYANVVQHTPRDTIERVEPASLQLLGDQVLGVAKVYGDLDLVDVAKPDRAFFTLPGIGLVHYPAAWSRWIAVALVGGLSGVLVVGCKRRDLRLRNVALGVVGGAASLAGAGALGALAASGYESWFPDPRLGTSSALGEYVLPSSGPFLAVVLALLFVCVAALYQRASARLGDAELAIAFLVIWVGLSVVAGIATPVGAYLFQLPTVVGVLAWLWLMWRPDRDPFVLTIPAAAAAFLVTEQSVMAFFGDGVAVLPSLAFVTVILGWILPVFTGLRRRGEASVSLGRA